MASGEMSEFEFTSFLTARLNLLARRRRLVPLVTSWALALHWFGWDELTLIYQTSDDRFRDPFRLVWIANRDRNHKPASERHSPIVITCDFAALLESRRGTQIKDVLAEKSGFEHVVHVMLFQQVTYFHGFAGQPVSHLARGARANQR
jgi:hypothetical protein